MLPMLHKPNLLTKNKELNYKFLAYFIKHES